MFEFIGEITAKINGCWVVENHQGFVEFGDNGIAYITGQTIRVTFEPTDNESCIRVQSKVSNEGVVRINLNRAYISVRETGVCPGYLGDVAEYWNNVKIGDNFRIKTEVL
jgi:hypothetical protein